MVWEQNTQDRREERQGAGAGGDGRCPSLAEDAGTHTGEEEEEEEGSYHGLAPGNGYKGKKKVWDMGFGQVLA